MPAADDRDDWLLSVPELEQAPELALPAVPDRSLEIAAYAVVVAHPELASPDPPPSWRPPDPGTRCADTLIHLPHRTRRALALYRIAVLRTLAAQSPADPPAAEDDIPF